MVRKYDANLAMMCMVLIRSCGAPNGAEESSEAKCYKTWGSHGCKRATVGFTVLVHEATCVRCSQ